METKKASFVDKQVKGRKASRTLPTELSGGLRHGTKWLWLYSGIVHAFKRKTTRGWVEMN